MSPDPVDDNLAEVYVPLDEESFMTVGMSDLLFNDLSQLSIHSSTKLGMVAFHKLVSQMTHFVVLLKSLITLSFESEFYPEAHVYRQSFERRQNMYYKYACGGTCTLICTCNIMLVLKLFLGSFISYVASKV